MSSLSNRFPIYSKLLWLYPKSYREKYQEQLLQTTADMLEEAETMGSKFVIWSRVAIDLPVNVFQTQLHYSRGVIGSGTPPYIKRNSLISLILLLPFMLALTANALDKVINNHVLYKSWLWRAPDIQLWVLWLPEAAFLLILGTYLYSLVKQKRSERAGTLKHLMNFRLFWPILLPGVLAFGILFIVAFHDSGQCWVHDPSYITSHLGQAWQCTIRNQSLKGFRYNF